MTRRDMIRGLAVMGSGIPIRAEAVEWNPQVLDLNVLQVATHAQVAFIQGNTGRDVPLYSHVAITRQLRQAGMDAALNAYITNPGMLPSGDPFDDRYRLSFGREAEFFQLVADQGWDRVHAGITSIFAEFWFRDLPQDNLLPILIRGSLFPIANPNQTVNEITAADACFYSEWALFYTSFVLRAMAAGGALAAVAPEAAVAIGATMLVASLILKAAC